MIDLRTLPPDLQERYGRRRRRSPWVWVLPALAGLVLAYFTAQAAWQIANPPVRWKLLTWSAAADHTTVTFEVRRPANAEVTCIVRVSDADRVDVGEATVTIPPGTDYAQPTYDIRTLSPGRVVDLVGCAQGTVPTVPAGEFAPGTTNPAQPWTPEGSS